MSTEPLRLELSPRDRPPQDEESPMHRAATEALHGVARRFNVTACDGGAGDEPCMFPLCIAMGCEAEPCAVAPTPEEGPERP